VTTIAYDLPVKNLIAGLDATGHVSHVQHRKTHVTIHHNGARLSHEGVLEVWKVRPASAHFDIDGVGDCAQYVRAAEYAWACGNTEGNQKSISIEMANSTLGPLWEVAQITWTRAARLAGWLFARVIGARPTRETLVVHKRWSATACAGPHIDGVYNLMLAIAQDTYDSIVYGIVKEKVGDMAVSVLQGDQSDQHWLVEVTGDGASKKHITTIEHSQVFQTLLGQNGVRKVPQWTIDWITQTGSIGD
jgi:hypothetical protein